MIRHRLQALARATLSACLALFAAFAAASPARADLIHGFVRDAQGNPVFNADFNVYDAATGVKLPPSDKTDATGKYRLVVDPGRYELLVRPVIGNGLAASGDEVFLRDTAGNIVDSVSWGSDTRVYNPPVPTYADGHSFARKQLSTDNHSASDWFDLTTPTPGR